MVIGVTMPMIDTNSLGKSDRIGLGEDNIEEKTISILDEAVEMTWRFQSSLEEVANPTMQTSQTPTR